MSSKKEELELELKQLIGSLGKLQKNNPTLLGYLPSSLKVEIDKALFALDNASENNNEGDLPYLPFPIFKQWYESVINFMEKAIKNLQKDTYQSFDKKALAKCIRKTKPKFLSNKDLEDYIISIACSKITPAIGFGLSNNLLSEADIIELAEIWQQCIGKTRCLTENDLPPTDFLAKKVLELYIESSIDGWDIDPGEYTKIKAGYIYFYVKGNYEMKYGPDQKGFIQGSIVFKSGNFSYKPVLDDTKGGSNAIEVLKQLYGENTKLVDLPIKLKLNAVLTIADPLDFFGVGMAGFNTLIFDRTSSGAWTCSSDHAKMWETKFADAEKLAGKKLNIKDFIENHLLSDFTLSDLIGDGW
jgi:hypothetical protein